MEYEKAGEFVSNDLMICIKLEHPFWSSIGIIQSKTEPAVHERVELEKFGLTMAPVNEDKFIFSVNSFRFSNLICNELLDINNRSPLRGKIDLLNVLAWNQDINVYDALAQSASLDLHAFVGVVNNKKYGDTRLLGPYKQTFKRDILRISGGNHDLIMTGTLAVKKLSEFQIIKLENPIYGKRDEFKPLPTGFERFENGLNQNELNVDEND